MQMLMCTIALGVVFVSLVSTKRRAEDVLSGQIKPNSFDETIIDSKVARKIHVEKDTRLRGAFVYDVNVIDIDISTQEMSLKKGERMANNLYIHVLNDIVNVIVLPGAEKAYRVSMTKSDRGKFVFALSGKDISMNFISAGIIQSGHQVILALWVDFSN